MVKNSFLVILFFITQDCFANYLQDNVKTYKVDNLDLVHIEDDSLPIYQMNILFKAGAATDSKGKAGETQAAFENLTAGTQRYKQSEIQEAFEFYGSQMKITVTHEYVNVSLSGLAKDIYPTTHMLCHVMRKATFPINEVKRYKKRVIQSIQNLVVDRRALADRVFRELSMKGTPFSYPMQGTIRTIKKITAKDLKKKMDFFNDQVAKKIFISGPKQVLAVRNIIKNDCKWGQENEKIMVENIEVNKDAMKKDVIYFLPVDKANQAQIRLGRLMKTQESQKQIELSTFASSVIGGGFTSELMRTLRVENGLVYSVSAFASSQKNYGRVGIFTATRNDGVAKTLRLIDQSVQRASSSLSVGRFEQAKRTIKGRYLLGLESSESFMSAIIMADHRGLGLDTLYDFPKVIDETRMIDLQSKMYSLYNFKDHIKFVLGSKKLIKILKQEGFEVKILDVKDYL